MFERFRRKRLTAETAAPRDKLEEMFRKEYASRVSELKGVISPEHYDQLVPHPTNIAAYPYWYLNDDQVYSAVNDLIAMAVGGGFYTECEENEQAKAIVDDFCKSVGLDQHLQNVGLTTLIYGFCPVERWFIKRFTPVKMGDWSKIADMQVKLLPPHTVYWKRTKQGRHLGFTQRYYIAGAQAITYKPNELVWFNHRPVGANPYGTSIIGPVSKLLKAKEQTHKDMPKIIHRYASPLTVWETDGPIGVLKNAVTGRQPNEDIFIGNVPKDTMRFNTVEIDPRGRFDNYINNIHESILEGLNAPSIRWFRNATEASSRSLMEIAERNVQSIQRDVKRCVERQYWEMLLKRYGIREVPTLHWGAKPTGLEDIDLRGLADLVKGGAVTPQQAVDLLRQMGVPVEEAEEEPVPQEPLPDETPGKKRGGRGD